ncbi:MAG: hypothetical protein ACLFTA_03740, partial [Candidatus Nanohaloarchaea archaeon]
MEQAFAVVLVAGLTVFGLAYVGMEGFSTQDPGEQLTVFNKSVGTVGDVTEDVRTVDLGSFTVGEGRGEIQAFRSDEQTVSHGMILGDPLSFQYEASQPKNATVEFRVIGREGSGSIYVGVNGEKVFEEPMVSDFSGTGTTVEIDQRHLKAGVNRFEIGTTKGGLISSTEYLLEDIEVEVNDRKYHERREDFDMYTHEFDNFRGAELNFRIPVDASAPAENLEIRVNDRTISEETRAQGEYTVEFDEDNADLRPGKNEIKFLTSGQAFYDIENAYMEVGYAVTSDPEARTERIELSSSELDFINRESTQEAIRFDYVNLNNPNNLQIDLNNETYDLKPQNGVNTQRIDENVFEEVNTLTLSSEGSFRMENLEVVSR